MNAAEFAELYTKIRDGRSSSENRRIYWAYVSLLISDITEGYSDSRQRFGCVHAEIMEGYKETHYIFAVYRSAYWKVEAVVGIRSATVVGVFFVGADNTTVKIADSLDRLLLEGSTMKQPSYVPWSMDAVLHLAGKGVVICERCRYPYELCQHSREDKKAILAL